MFNPYIGLCKFIMAVLVVAIHVEPFNGNMAFYYNNCLARIADPMFFTLSAYFLFQKLLASNWDKTIFIKQIKRLFMYYGVWLVIYSPVILTRTWSRCDSFLAFIWEVFRQIFLTGPYGALWFLPALILGLILTYFVGKYTSSCICMAISLPFFLLSVLEMEYFTLVKDIAWLTAANDFFCSIFGWLGNGINFAWFFCALGLFLATPKTEPLTSEEEIRIKAERSWDVKHGIGGYRNFSIDLRDLINFLAILGMECTLIRRYNLGISYGVMLSLIPVTYYLMRVLLQMPEKLQKRTNKIQASDKPNLFARIAKYLQDMSLLIFPLHYGIMEGMEYLMRNHAWYMESTTIQYVAVLLITCGISTVILGLGKKYAFFRMFYAK